MTYKGPPTPDELVPELFVRIHACEPITTERLCRELDMSLQHWIVRTALDEMKRLGTIRETPAGWVTA